MLAFLEITFALCLGAFAHAQFCGEKPIVNASKITFTLYNQANTNGTLLDDNNVNLVNALLRCVFVIHGWLQAGNQGWIIQMKNEYLKISDVNVISANWSEYSFCEDYYPSAEVVPEIGVIIGDYIWSLVSKGLVQLENSQINGASLGAHVAGVAGQEIQIKSGGTKIQRINGLEAVLPDFEFAPLNQRLDSGDANFVQAIHTSTFGIQTRYGTVDVYFNCNLLSCGLSQPGCPLYPGVPLPTNPLLPILFCDHIRSVVYFIYSISKPPNTLLAVLCSCVNFGLKLCGSNKIIVGEYCPASATPGEYYLNTNCTSPYGLSEAGSIGGVANYLCIF